MTPTALRSQLGAAVMNLRHRKDQFSSLHPLAWTPSVVLAKELQDNNAWDVSAGQYSLVLVNGAFYDHEGRAK